MPRQTEEQYFEELIETYINGNISTFREAIQKMRKKKLVRLIMYATQNEYDDAINFILNTCQ